MYTAKPETNVVWNVFPLSLLAYKIIQISVIGQLYSYIVKIILME